MKIFCAVAFSTLLMLAPFTFSEQNQQAAPPPSNQSSYPSETQRMTPEEKSQTPEAKGQLVDLNTSSKADLAALPGVGPKFAQKIIDARPFASKESLLKDKVIPTSTYDKIKNLVTASGPKRQSLPE